MMHIVTLTTQKNLCEISQVIERKSTGNKAHKKQAHFQYAKIRKSWEESSVQCYCAAVLHGGDVSSNIEFRYI